MLYFAAVAVTDAEKSEWYQSLSEPEYMRVNENAVRGSKIIVLSSNELLIELIQVKSQIKGRRA